jgi:hypothetical protein
MAEKNVEASRMWRNMPEEEKKHFADKAEKMRNPDISKLSDDQKIKLMKQHKKKTLIRGKLK